MKIGILGAGQLGRMLALAGYPLDMDFVFLDPATEACAAPLGDHLHADYSDQQALARFCAQCDVATFEFENVPADSADYVAEQCDFYPPPPALVTGQDRLSEKKLFDALGIPVPAYLPVASREALGIAIRQIGYPALLKTRRLGYDGKGQAMIRQAQDLDAAWEKLGAQPLILEQLVAFERELSCLGVRGRNGETVFYPVVENVHRDGILHQAIPRRDDPLQEQAQAHSQRVLDALNYVGVMAFEFFVADGRLLANEIAPRVHNSGHWTIEGAETSQFENHLRAIAGLPLGSTTLRGHSAMINFIGEPPLLQRATALAGVHVHRYGKRPKPLRKVGHATVTAEDSHSLASRLAALRALIDESA